MHLADTMHATHAIHAMCTSDDLNTHVLQHSLAQLAFLVTDEMDVFPNIFLVHNETKDMTVTHITNPFGCPSKSDVGDCISIYKYSAHCVIHSTDEPKQFYADHCELLGRCTISAPNSRGRRTKTKEKYELMVCEPGWKCSVETTYWRACQCSRNWNKTKWNVASMQIFVEQIHSTDFSNNESDVTIQRQSIIKRLNNLREKELALYDAIFECRQQIDNEKKRLLELPDVDEMNRYQQ